MRFHPFRLERFFGAWAGAYVRVIAAGGAVQVAGECAAAFADLGFAQ